MRSAISPPRTRSRAVVAENADAQEVPARGLVAMIKSVCAALSPMSAGSTSQAITIAPSESDQIPLRAQVGQAATPVLSPAPLVVNPGPPPASTVRRSARVSVSRTPGTPSGTTRSRLAVFPAGGRLVTDLAHAGAIEDARSEVSSSKPSTVASEDCGAGALPKSASIVQAIKVRSALRARRLSDVARDAEQQREEAAVLAAKKVLAVEHFNVNS